MSRHGSGCLVVVWCRDQGFGPRQGHFCGRSRGWLRHRFEVTTWPVEIGCRDLDWALRPDLVQCTVLCTVQVTVWTLFMSTVHRVKKKKEYKNFFVYDLKYEIFILKLL